MMIIDLEKAIRMYNINVKVMPLIGAQAMTIPTKEGYVVLINDQLEKASQELSFTHELFHIYLGHLDHRKDLTRDEKEAEVKQMMLLVRVE